MVKDEFFYKKSRVNGEDYLQIWRREGEKSVYVRSLGKAGKLLGFLVLMDEKVKQTKEVAESLTKISGE
jgi:hypothetical protein